jgi:hypothetical protein
MLINELDEARDLVVVARGLVNHPSESIEIPDE